MRWRGFILQQLEAVIAKVEELKRKHEESVSEKNALREEAEMLELKLDRANKLVTGLSGYVAVHAMQRVWVYAHMHSCTYIIFCSEKIRWEASILTFEAALVNLPGDVLVAAAFLSYAGPFDTLYRDNLVKTWLSGVKEQSIPYSEVCVRALLFTPVFCHFLLNDGHA